MSDEVSGGFQPGRTSALDYFKKFDRSIGENEGSGQQVGGQAGGRIYWFVYGRQGSKQVLAGPYNSRDEAVRAAGQRLSGWTYKVLGMPTKDRSRARRLLAHEVAKGGQLAESLKRMQREV